MRAGRALLIVVVLGLIGVGNPASAGVITQSTFDTDVDGWVTFTTTAGFPLSNISFAAAGGNPGGAARHDAPSDSQTSFFLAPSKFVTGLHSAVGGSIAWDEATINPGGPSFDSIDIQVAAGTNRIRLSVTPPPPASHPAYSEYDVDFNVSTGWIFFDGPPCVVGCPPGTVATQEEIDAVLAGATQLIIRAEFFTTDTPDSAFLDNVVLRDSDLAQVPVPPALVLVAMGTVALGVFRRRSDR
jgi:hypothetical protein